MLKAAPLKSHAKKANAKKLHTKKQLNKKKPAQKLKTKSARNMSSANVPKIANWINGQEVQSTTDKWFPIISPATGETLALCPQATPAELKMAVEGAQAAQKQWRLIPVSVRQRMMMKLINLVNENENELVQSIVRETNKTVPDAKGDVFRGVEVMEFQLGAINHIKGETVEQVARDVDTYSYRQPLGVCGAILPFNFPFMLVAWAMSPALTTGNAMVLKPSEKTPTASLILARLAKQAGFPDGLFQVVNGAHDTVNFICDEPAIKAVSFVGSNPAGEYIANKCTQNGKRVQSNMAAKNHGVFMPDADKEFAINALVSAGFGGSAQRCMALTTAVFVGDAKEWIPELVARAQKLKAGPGEDANSDFGPLISCQSIQRINKIVDDSIPLGAEVLLDGRNPTHITDPKYKNGNWMNPTVIKISMDKIGNSIENLHKIPAYKQELFGPGLVVIEAKDLDQAIDIVNANEFGNGASIMTNSGAVARHFQFTAEPAQIGINIPIPIAPAFFSFTSNKNSFRGTHNFFGKNGINFFTQEKTVTSQWKMTPDVTKVSMSFPVTKQ